MNLTCEHNLNEQELAKALHGIAEAEGIAEELVKALKKTGACDLTPKLPKDKAIRQIYDMLTAEFRKAAADIEMYAEHLLTLKKSQLSFDFNAPLHLEATTDKTGHVVHRWMADHHSAQQASTVVETPKPQEASMQTDIFYDKMTRTWVCRVIDAEGNQIGDADYEPTKPLAQATAQRMLEEKTPKQPVTDLKEQLEAHKEQLKQQYIVSVRGTLERLQYLYGKNLREKNNNASIRNSNHYKTLESIGGSIYRDTDGNYHVDEAAASDNGQQYADITVDSWHDKIMYKVKDLQNSTVHRLDGNRFMISGERDGKRIRIEQDMIVNRSTNGLLFNQFPARIYVDGKFHSEAAYKKLTGDDAVEKQAKAQKDAEKRAKYMLPSGKFAKHDKVKLKLKRGEERYETEGTVLTERNGKTVVRYGHNRFNMRDIAIETDKLERWQTNGSN